MKPAQERLGAVFAAEQLLHESEGPSVKNLLVATSHDSMTLDQVFQEGQEEMVNVIV